MNYSNKSRSDLGSGSDEGEEINFMGEELDRSTSDIMKQSMSNARKSLNRSNISNDKSYERHSRDQSFE